MKYRMTAMLCALLTSAALGGCSKEPSPSDSVDSDVPMVTNDADTGSELTVTLSHSYRAEALPDELYGISYPVVLGEQAALLSFNEAMEGTLTICSTVDGSTAAFLNYGENTAPVGVAETADGYAVLLREYIEAEPEAPFRYTMEHYDGSWKLLSAEDVTARLGTERIAALLQDGDGDYAVLGGDAVVFYDRNLTQLGSVPMDASAKLYMGGDGNPYVFYIHSSGGYAAAWIDKASMQLQPIGAEGMPLRPQGIFSGSKEYPLYVYDDTAAYGVDVENGRCEEVINWTNSDFTGEYLSSAAALEDGSFLLHTYDASYGDITGWKLTARTQEELEQLEILSLAVHMRSDVLNEAVCLYNRQNNGIRIVIEDYSRYNTESDTTLGLEKFEEDMLAGKVADIICTSELPFTNYANKGLFADLYPFMEADADFHEEDYLMNFFTSMEYGGELLKFGFTYDVDTMAARTEYVGEEQGLRFAEYMSLADSLPEGMDLFGNMHREDALRMLCMNNLGSFVDPAQAVCSFDTPEFVQMLELCSRYPSADEMMVQSFNGFENGTVLLCTDGIAEPYDYHRITAGVFGGDEVTFVGVPAEEGNGGMFVVSPALAMSAQSQYKEEIWDFFMFLLSEEYQRTFNRVNLRMMAVRRSVLEAQMEAATQPAMEGEDLYRMYHNGEMSVPIGNATEEEMDALYAYLRGITQSGYYDAHLETIIREEAQMYFAGDQTAAQAAEMIQSRASIYLSEQS